MEKYLYFIKNGFEENFIYRTNSLLMIFGSLVSLFISINIWQVLYQSKTAVSGVNLHEMIIVVVLNSIN